MRPALTRLSRHGWMLAAAFLVTLAVYWPGLSGAYLFDDYPNIVDNHGVQPPDATLPSLVRAALSSPASEFKRPLASLSFAANYLATGLDPYWMKLTNLILHLLNGLLVFLLARLLLRSAPAGGPARPFQHGRHADCGRLDAAADQPHLRAVRGAAHGKHGEPVRAARADWLRHRPPPHAWTGSSRGSLAPPCSQGSMGMEPPFAQCPRPHPLPHQRHRPDRHRHPGQGNCGDAAAVRAADRMGAVPFSQGAGIANAAPGRQC